MSHLTNRIGELHAGSVMQILFVGKRHERRNHVLARTLHWNLIRKVYARSQAPAWERTVFEALPPESLVPTTP